jgi:hypothetical protein
MNTLKHSLWLAALALGVGAVSPSWVAAQAPIPGSGGIEVQPRGPIHEAFAQPPDPQPAPPPIVPKAPPPPVPEEPPPQAPAGADVQWINGYWSWDADRNEFLWVSGVYRNAPPGQRYVAGYWEQTPDGWRWVSGFWAPQDQSQPPYLSQPPAPLDNGPSLPPPNADSFYTPGVWIPRDGRFVWRPGCWRPVRPGYLWTPASYQWTPGGYVFVDGHWDYPLADRGLLFAPVVFQQPLWLTPGWAYRPTAVVATGPLLDGLFVRPAWRHYYFGNYYGPSYARLGYQPWYAYGPRSFDPLFSYYRWVNRGNPGWQAGLRQTYVARAGGTVALPVQTVRPLSQVGGVRLQAVPPSQLALQRSRAQQVRQAAVVRSRGEAQRKTVVVQPRVAAVRPAAAPRVAAAAPRPAVAVAAPRPQVVRSAPAPAARAHPAPAHARSAPAGGGHRGGSHGHGKH